MQSKQRPVLLQRRESNHGALRSLTGPTLAAQRVITMRQPGGEAKYLTGYISLPIGDVIGSNPRFGALLASIDETTGRLGPGYDLSDIRRVVEPVPVHPVTSEHVAGFHLPNWDETVDLAVEAHNTFSKIALIGWDIAVTSDGPVIIEGSGTPSGDSIQIARKEPLGSTQFPELYMANVNTESQCEHVGVI
jgi:hypothetical protein